MLAEEIQIPDGDTPSWRAVRPLLDAALRLEQSDELYAWHGWSKRQISGFFQSLPDHCSLVAAVWEGTSIDEGAEEQEHLSLGVVCEVINGEICSLRTLESLVEGGLKPVDKLEPGVDDALEILRIAGTQVAPVAWALFTEKPAWNEWIFEGASIGGEDKEGLLTTLARQGRCVLMGSEVRHFHEE